MNIGLIVEGDRDSAAYPELIRKIRNDVGSILALPCGGVAGVRASFVVWLKHFKWHAPYIIDKAVVIVDSDCDGPAAWELVLQQTYEKSEFVPGFPVHFHATKCELETWLLSDENAINQVSIARGKGKAVPAITIPLESYKNAKELFNKVLSQAGLPVTPKVYGEIAAAATIERIAQRCPHFQEFADKVRAC